MNSSTFKRLVATGLALALFCDWRLNRSVEPLCRRGGENSFGSEALSAAVLTVGSQSFEPGVTEDVLRDAAQAAQSLNGSGVIRGMRLPLGSRLDEKGKEKLLARFVVENGIFYGSAKDRYRPLRQAMEDHWFPALRAGLSYAIGRDSAVAMLLLSHFQLSFYRGGSLLSFFKPMRSFKGHHRNGLGWNELLFESPTVFTLVSLPHELLHAVLADKAPHLQEIAAMSLNVDWFLGNVKKPSDLDWFKVQEVARILDVPMNKLSLIDQFLYELKMLRESAIPTGRKRGVPHSLDPAWNDEHTLRTFYRDLADEHNISSPVQRIKHIVSYLLNNPDLYPREVRQLRRYESATPVEWKALAARIEELKRLANQRLEKAIHAIITDKTVRWPASKDRGRRALGMSILQSA